MKARYKKKLKERKKIRDKEKLSNFVKIVKSHKDMNSCFSYHVKNQKSVIHQGLLIRNIIHLKFLKQNLSLV